MSSESVETTVKGSIALIVCMLSIAAAYANPTWRIVEHMSAQDKAHFDPATSTPRHPNFPEMPAELYPFEPPYTAEEMGYRSAEFPHISRWSATALDVFGSITSSGYMNQGQAVFYVSQEYGFGLESYLYKAPAGKVQSRWAMYDTFPPENEGSQSLWIPYRTDHEFRTKMDFFVYSPQLRRVRRLPAPRRDQRFPDNAQTFDDVVGRDPWEFQWSLLGTDVLYETVRLPNTRPTIMLNRGERGFVERSSSSFKTMGDNFPHYLPDGGVACWVLKATPRDDWLPGYLEGALVLWLEKTTFFPLRQEKYDRDGKLMTIEVRLAEHVNAKHGTFGYAPLINVYWNIPNDLISYSFHDPHYPHDWTEEEKNMLFTAEFMRRDWLLEPLKSEVRILKPEQFYMRPKLHADKFPETRDTSLPADTEAHLKAQNQAGRLVFEIGDTSGD